MVIRKHHIIERSDLVSRRNKKIEITLSIWLKENSQIVAICNFCFTSNNLQTSRGQGEKRLKREVTHVTCVYCDVVYASFKISNCCLEHESGEL